MWPVVLAVVLAQAPDVADRREVTVAGYRLKSEGAGYSYQGRGFTAHIAADGTIKFQDVRPTPGQAVVPVLALAAATKAASPPQGRRFGKSLARAAASMVTHPTLALSDEDLRRDPHYAPKADFMTATEDFRSRLRATFDEKSHRSAPAAARARVAAVATDETRPLAERHRLVFELWDECDASPGGTKLRAAIEVEARRQFPPGTPRAYTPAELTQLNAGQAAAFAPYPAAKP